MTEELEFELRDRLTALAAAVPVDAPGGLSVVTPRMRPGRTGRRIALTGIAPLVGIVVIGTIAAGLAKLGPFAPGSTAFANGPVEATTVDGPFELTIRSAKAQYGTGEPIEIEATLTYRGPSTSIEINHAQGAPYRAGPIGGPLGFGIEEPVVGDLVLGPSWRQSCERSTLVAGAPLSAAFAKSAAFSGSNPRADEYRALLTDPVLRLTDGVWHVYAVAEFSLGGCGGEQHALRATIEIEVTAESSATAAPTSQPSSSIPLPATPFGQVSVAQLDWAVGIVQSYGAQHPESFAALWINRPEGGPVGIASSWTQDLEVHRVWLEANIGFLVTSAVFQAQFTEVELERARDQIGAQLDWLDSVPAHLTDFGIDGKGNRLELGVSSASTDAPALIQAHYAATFGFDPDMFVVTSDGTGAYFIPWGTVHVTLDLPASGIPADVDLVPDWESDVNGLRCGQGDVGVRFDALPCQEGTWTILVVAQRGAERVVVGSGVVNVVAGATVDLTIAVGPID